MPVKNEIRLAVGAPGPFGAELHSTSLGSRSRTLYRRLGDDGRGEDAAFGWGIFGGVLSLGSTDDFDTEVAENAEIAEKDCCPSLEAGGPCGV